MYTDKLHRIQAGTIRFIIDTIKNIKYLCKKHLKRGRIYDVMWVYTHKKYLKGAVCRIQWHLAVKLQIGLSLSLLPSI